MSYYLCPRCQFQVAAKKNRCTTCGFDMLTFKNAQAQAGDEKPKASVWVRLFGSDKKQEATSEKPALG